MIYDISAINVVQRLKKKKKVKTSVDKCERAVFLTLDGRKPPIFVWWPLILECKDVSDFG